MKKFVAGVCIQGCKWSDAMVWQNIASPLGYGPWLDDSNEMSLRALVQM